MNRSQRPHRRKQQGSLALTLSVIGSILLIVILAAVAALKLEPIQLTEAPQSGLDQPDQSQTEPAQTPAEDDPIRWLTEDELTYAQPEELDELVSQRMALCTAWLTAEELDKLTPQQKYDVANQRKQEAERGTNAQQVIAADSRVSDLEGRLLELLLATLAETDEAEWESIFEQLKPANRTQLKVDASSALNASRDFDYLEGDAREDVALRMMVTPREDWLGLLRQILQEDAEQRAAHKAESSTQPSSQTTSSSSESSSLAEEETSASAESGADGREEEESASSSGQKEPSSSSSSKEEEPEDEDEEPDDSDLDEVRVYNLASGKTVTGSPFEIVSKVVQNEMGSFHEEALKAQAVAAYSYILHENNAGRTPSLRLSAATSKVEKATKAVLGEVLTYKNKPAFTPFFATSAGATNSSADVWGGSYPYLISVDSSVDEKAKNYRYEKTMSEEDVRDRLEDYYNGIELEDDPDEWFEVLSYTDGGYNKKMKVGDRTTTARILRESVLLLRSAAFEWEYDGEDFVFITYGYGHGVGMSQTGANEYAKKGWTYDEILDHYYPGTKLK